MVQTRSRRVLCGLGSAIVVLLAGLPGLTGCEESSGRKAAHSAQQNADDAGRLLRGSQQDLILNPQQVQAASQAQKPDQQQALAARIAAQRLECLQPQTFPQSLDRLAEAQKQLKPADSQAFQKFTQQVLTLLQNESRQQEELNKPSAEQAQLRLNEARRKLQDAVAAARRSGQREAQVAPEMLLGALNLTLARDRLAELRRLSLDLRRQEALFTPPLSQLVQQRILAAQLDTQTPDAAVAALQALLDDPAKGFRAELQTCAAKIDQLEARQNQVRQRRDRNLQQARTLQQQRLAKLQEAESVAPQRRYEIGQEIYQLEVGSGDGPSRTPGLFDYEGQAQTAEGEFAAVADQLAAELMRRERLLSTSAALEKSISDLHAPADQARRAALRLESDQRRRQALATLTQQVEQMTAAETRYRAARVAAVGAFDEARAAFQRAAAAASGPTRQYLQFLEQLAAQELVQLWLADRQHNQAAADALLPLASLPDLQSLVGPLLQDRQQNAAQAENSAAQLQSRPPDNL